MNEHEREKRVGERRSQLTVLQGRDSREAPRRRDVVVDLSGIRSLDLTNLALLLTAQQQAQQEHRAIWLAGVPMAFWEILHGMGLARFFKAFPTPGEIPA